MSSGFPLTLTAILSFILTLTLTARCVSGRNVTERIDSADTGPYSVTELARVIYHPSVNGAWISEAGLAPSQNAPDPGRAYQKTYTYTNGNYSTSDEGSVVRSIVVDFFGTSITVYFIVENEFPTECDVTLDGGLEFKLRRRPGFESSSEAFSYQVPLITYTNLAEGVHRLEIQVVSDTLERRNYVNFDYAEYSYDTDSADLYLQGKPDTPTPTPTPAPAPLQYMQEKTPDHMMTILCAIILACTVVQLMIGIACTVVQLMIGIGALFLFIRSRSPQRSPRLAPSPFFAGNFDTGGHGSPSPSISTSTATLTQKSQASRFNLNIKKCAFAALACRRRARSESDTTASTVQSQGVSDTGTTSRPVDARLSGSVDPQHTPDTSYRNNRTGEGRESEEGPVEVLEVAAEDVDVQGPISTSTNQDRNHYAITNFLSWPNTSPPSYRSTKASSELILGRS
ncbi:hypothetical protein CC1G_15752 [Coprinopsis cinerea okayama7|uniref:Uncharacterized protein n=1 Tax=Coprinopsis cinerea (strain Okayama-7 / 130 / ATCC MYA-4618 / FGSC 9003) TaxID=240176 RepID=D6RQJ9_COPC7|nr:hypothetical protein CC1G_15752 [Coprinopsis cinerea okayama7\|eukprot:XP_002910323.1 hypothetical protein CC1G_15752 [Coprinopsis cinerea okayama7\